MRSSSWWSFVAVLVLTASVRAEDTYTIKLKQQPDVGKAVTIKDTETNSQSNKITDGDGKVIDDGKKHTIKIEEVYTETILEKGDKVPNKFKRTYEKAARTLDDKTDAFSYEGRTIVFERKDGKYVATAEGDKPVSEADLTSLTQKANSDTGTQYELFQPSKPVKVGDTWKITGKQITQAVGGNDLDAEKSSGEGKLTKVYEKDGHKFGNLVVTVKLAPGKAPKDVTFETPPVVELKLTLDAAIDGSSTASAVSMTGSSKGKYTLERGGKKLTIDTSAEMSGKTEQSAEK
jgi:hypothetical protein